jgi:hypothetical protein
MLATDRANARAQGGRTNWTAGEVQAAQWVARKSEAPRNASAGLKRRLTQRRTSLIWNMHRSTRCRARTNRFQALTAMPDIYLVEPLAIAAVVKGAPVLEAVEG